VRKNSRFFGVSACIVFPRNLSHGGPPDVLSEPDDSYPIREVKQTKKEKSTDPSGGIGAFFSKSHASTADLEDVVMNEGETATANDEEPNV